MMRSGIMRLSEGGTPTGMTADMVADFVSWFKGRFGHDKLGPKSWNTTKLLWLKDSGYKNYGDSLKDFVIASGYKRLIDISVQTLKPGNGLMIHKDDHTQRECYPYIKGCKKVYWTVKGSEGVYFKLGKSGLLPLDSPLMINTAEIPHSVIHDGDEIRTSILVYGELN